MRVLRYWELTDSAAMGRCGDGVELKTYRDGTTDVVLEAARYGNGGWYGEVRVERAMTG